MRQFNWNLKSPLTSFTVEAPMRSAEPLEQGFSGVALLAFWTKCPMFTVGSRPMHWRKFSSIHSLQPLDASNIHHLYLVSRIKNISRYCQCPYGAKIIPTREPLLQRKAQFDNCHSLTSKSKILDIVLKDYLISSISTFISQYFLFK